MISSATHVGLVALLAGAAVADVRCRRIPNAVCLGLLACGAVASLVDPAAPRITSSAAAVGLVFAIAWLIPQIGAGPAMITWPHCGHS